MTTVPAPTGHAAREEWADTDFDIPDDSPLDAESDKDDEDEDWDVEMNLKIDLTANSAGARARAIVAGIAARSDLSRTPAQGQSRMITFTSMPRKVSTTLEEDSLDEIDDDEGISTIKIACLTAVSTKPKPLADSPTEIDEDLEEAFLLPQDLTTLSLAPLSLVHRSSKNSLEWGDKDHTTSSQSSSDAYSTLGFNDNFPSSNSVSSASQGESETDDDEDEGDLEGLVIPTDLFETGHGATQLTKILEMKKKIQLGDTHSKTASPNPEDDFEMGLVIDDDVDFSPSRLVIKTREANKNKSTHDRSKSAPSRFPPSLRAPSRSKADRAKSPTNPPVSSARQLERLRLSPSPPLKPMPPLRSQTSQGVFSAQTGSSGSSHSHKSKSSSVRGQKSHSALKAPTPPATQRRLTRKASLSSLMDPNSQPVASTSSGSASVKYPRYDAPTAASRAKVHTSSTSRIHGMEIDPSRPSTPSSNSPAHRLTMPTTMRLKSRPSIASVFPGSPTFASSSSSIKNIPPPSRPPSSLSNKSRSTAPSPKPSPPVAPRLLRKPKRPRLYGDGTELDGFEDLPTDRDKESQYRVAPKGYGNRIPGGTYSAKTLEDAPKPAGSSSKKVGLEPSGRTPASPPRKAPAPINSLRRTSRIEFPPKATMTVATTVTDPSLPTKKKKVGSPVGMRQKPKLIRNLGGANSPKVVGEMKWNPQTLRWEGNDQVLRDFDVATGTSTRPALITHLTGSSIGSPVGTFANGARVVGNMMFDPAKMCWISTLPPDEEEPDVFADLADDEDDDDWEANGGTIKASQQLQPGLARSDVSSVKDSSSTTSIEPPSPAPSRIRGTSDAGSDRGSRGSIVYDVDDEFFDKCRDAQERHLAEMKPWSSYLVPTPAPNRSHLYELRALATRRY